MTLLNYFLFSCLTSEAQNIEMNVVYLLCYRKCRVHNNKHGRNENYNIIDMICIDMLCTFTIIK